MPLGKSDTKCLVRYCFVCLHFPFLFFHEGFLDKWCARITVLQGAEVRCTIWLRGDHKQRTDVFRGLKQASQHRLYGGCQTVLPTMSQNLQKQGSCSELYPSEILLYKNEILLPQRVRKNSC